MTLSRLLLPLLLVACSGKEDPEEPTTSEADTDTDSDTDTDTDSDTDTDTDSDTDTDTDSDTDTDTSSTGDTGPTASRVRPGERCALTERVGTIAVEATFGSVYLSSELYDSTDPDIGDPSIVSGGCAFHLESTATCSCATNEVCSHDGTCVDPRLPLAHTLTATTSQGTQVLDGSDGTSWAASTIGGVTDAFTLQLEVGGLVIDLASTVPAEPVTNVVVSIEDDFASPGPLEATWDVPADPGWVISRIPINHHAPGPTFTDCQVQATDAVFSATEPMIDPLAVITGLEFQGLSHVKTAAVDLDEGCVDVQYGGQQHVSPTY